MSKSYACGKNKSTFDSSATTFAAEYGAQADPILGKPVIVDDSDSMLNIGGGEIVISLDGKTGTINPGVSFK